jgi:hypothetical protein
MGRGADRCVSSRDRSGGHRRAGGGVARGRGGSGGVVGVADRRRSRLEVVVPVVGALQAGGGVRVEPELGRRLLGGQALVARADHLADRRVLREVGDLLARVHVRLAQLLLVGGLVVFVGGLAFGSVAIRDTA